MFLQMEFIDIIKIIGACAAIIGTSYSIWNSKRSILRRIDRKESRIRQIDYTQNIKYGLDRGNFYGMDRLDIKRNKLQDQIEELKRYL
jgi:hypothetical protein